MTKFLCFSSIRMHKALTTTHRTAAPKVIKRNNRV